MFERQRVHQAAADAAKKLEDASKEAEETARVAAAQASPEETQVSLGGSTSAVAFNGRPLPAALRVCIRLSQFQACHTSFSLSGKVPGRG